MKPTKNCELCKRVFEKQVSDNSSYWVRKRYCSISCSKKGKPSWNKGIVLPYEVWNKGKTGIYSKTQLDRLSKKMSAIGKQKGFGKWMIGRKGEETNGWKGDNVGYGALHDWIRSELGTPNKCTNCDKVSDVPQMIHWANISHEYKRDLIDWIRLCAKCHKAFDKDRKQTKYLNR